MPADYSALQAELIEAFRSWKPTALAAVATKMVEAYAGRPPSEWAIKDIKKAFAQVFFEKSLPNISNIMGVSDIGSFKLDVLSQWDENAKLTGFTLTLAPHAMEGKPATKKWAALGFSTEPVFVLARELHGRGAKKAAAKKAAAKKAAAKKAATKKK